MENTKVLLADDDKLIHFLFKKMTSTISFYSPLSVFNDGKELLDYLEDKAESDVRYLIFLDINMPVMTGWEFLESIKNKPKFSNLSIVMFSSSIDQEDVNKAFSFDHVFHFESKPINREKLLVIWDKYHATVK